MTTIATDQPVRIDPAGMSRAKLAGRACAVCDKRWPRPQRVVGVWPDGRPAKLCPDCAGGLAP